MGYETANFFENLGSIIIFIVAQVLLVLIATILSVYHISCPCKKIRQKFSKSGLWSSSLTLFNGTFFEILVSVSLSMSIVSYLDDNLLSDSDYSSVVCSLIFALLIILYLVFVLFFVCCKAHQLQTVRLAELTESEVLENRNLRNESILL